MTFLTLCLLENKAKKSAKNCRWHFHVCVATILSQQLFRSAFIACRQCKSVRGFPAIYTSHDVNAPTGESNSLRSHTLAFSNCPITPIVSEWPWQRSNEWNVSRNYTRPLRLSATIPIHNSKDESSTDNNSQSTVNTSPFAFLCENVLRQCYKFVDRWLRSWKYYNECQGCPTVNQGGQTSL